MSDLEKEQEGQGVANPTPKRTLGVTKETVGGSAVSIPVPYALDRPTPQFTSGYHFPTAKLVAVHYIAEKDTKAGIKPVLSFFFKDSQNRQYNHIEFPIEDADAKFEDKLSWLQQRLKHIWDETIGDTLFPVDGLGGNATTFAEMFKDTAEKFNSKVTGEGDAAVKVFTKTLVYIKLTYGNKDRTQFPLFPNFLQKASLADKLVPVINLVVGPKDKVIAGGSSTSAGAAGFNGAGSAFSDASQGFAGEDFPDV